MSLKITDLVFANGVSLAVNRISGEPLDATTLIDFQEHGVLLETVNISTGNAFVFVPYSNIKDITQSE